MGIIIRKATAGDIDAVEKIYKEVHAHNMSNTNYCNWDNRIYPLRADAEGAEKAGTLYVFEEDGDVLGTAIFNHLQPPEYAQLEWNVKAEGNEVIVLHTLCVSTRARNKGIAKKFVSFGEELGRKLSCRAMRFDTSEFNKPAYGIYTGLGYAVVGKVLVHTSESMSQILYCFEKQL